MSCFGGWVVAILIWECSHAVSVLFKVMTLPFQLALNVLKYHESHHLQGPVKQPQKQVRSEVFPQMVKELCSQAVFCFCGAIKLIKQLGIVHLPCLMPCIEGWNVGIFIQECKLAVSALKAMAVCFKYSWSVLTARQCIEADRFRTWLQALVAAAKTGLSFAVIACGNHTCSSKKHGVIMDERAQSSKLPKPGPSSCRAVVFYRSTGGMADWVYEDFKFRKWSLDLAVGKTVARAKEVGLAGATSKRPH